jgi:hypothetical protein
MFRQAPLSRIQNYPPRFFGCPSYAFDLVCHNPARWLEMP